MSIDTKAGLEELIQKLKSEGFIRRSDLLDDYKRNSLDTMDVVKSVISDRAKAILFSYDLIEKEPDENGLYLLKMKGRNFESFKNEDEKIEQAEKKSKIDLANAKRIYRTYWLTFGIAIAGFLISLVLLILKLKGK